MASSKITKVTMFKSSDDKLHPTAAECELHETRLSVKPLVNEMLANAGFDFDSQMTLDEVSAFVSTNADALLKILAPLLPKKVRAPRGGAADLPVAPAAQDQTQARAPQDSDQAPAGHGQVPAGLPA